MWSREASSGTTPPYSACIWICEYSAWPSRPWRVAGERRAGLSGSRYSATPVSSQDVSIPSTSMGGLACGAVGDLPDSAGALL